MTRKMEPGSQCGPVGILQGSVLGNFLVVNEATIMGYADDTAIIVVTKHLADMELYLFEAITAIRNRQ